MGEIIDTTAVGINDVQTVSIDFGPANLDIKSTTFSSGGNVWSLGTSNGVDQVVWGYASTTPNWIKFTAPDTLFSLAGNLSTGSTQDFYLRLTMPADTSSNSEHNAIVTVVATSP